MGTRIIQTVAVGSRLGTRRQKNSIVTVKRYDVYDGDMRYKHSENRHFGHVYDDVVPTEIAIIQVTSERTMEFDTGVLAPRPGEAVHVFEHRILFRTVYDLFKDRPGHIVADGTDPFDRPVGRAPAIALAVLVAIASHLVDVETWHAVGYGCYSGLAIFVLQHAERAYGSRMLRLLRWRAVRRVRRALATR